MRANTPPCVAIPCMHAGASEQKALQQMLSSAGASCRSCCVCASPGQPATAPQADDDEADTLRFTTLSQLGFASMTLHLGKGGVSGACAATPVLPQ
jgi:hypothetical protein